MMKTIRPHHGLWSVMVSCNDWRNGTFAGSAERFELIGPDGNVAADFYMGGRVKFDAWCGGIRLGHPDRKREYATVAQCMWAGNWCWNQYWLPDKDAARLLRLLWKNGQCEAGWCALVDRLEAGERASVRMLRDVAAEGEAAR